MSGSSPLPTLSMAPSLSQASLLPDALRHLRAMDFDRRGPRSWDSGIPHLLKPMVKAYLLGYISSVAPRLSTLLLQYASRKTKTRPPFLESLQQIIHFGVEWQRFPTFCAVLVGGTTILEVPLQKAFQRYAASLSSIARRRLARWLSSFVAAWLSLKLLQSKVTAGFTDTLAMSSPDTDNVNYKTVRYAGRTLDLTLFAATRALDVIVGELFAQHKSRRLAAGKWTRTEALIAQLTDPAVFAASSALVMWTWIYLPARLPRAYNKWISSAASVDGRLTEALRRMRTGEMRYGEDTEKSLLQPMCEDFKWPEKWGDPAQTVPIPCEMVHMGCGPSCEFHAVSRFCRSWKWSMATYLPLNLLLVVRNPNAKGLIRAILSASRSSAFLGMFITLFYYGVCLARSRVGPHILGKDFAARQAIDGGLCVGTGCALCGWSILLENAGRRKDIGLFVAPRSIATLFPRRYALDKQWRETLVFAMSTAVVFTCVLENRKRVRGVLGNILGTVLDR